MDDSISTSDALSVYTTEYVRRLLIERRHIYEKLYNPGGSIILRGHALVDHDRPIGYSTEIGNTFHLDLIQLDEEFEKAVKDRTLTKKQIAALLTWADGMTSQQAADYLHAKGAVAIRRLRSKGTRRLQERLNDSGREAPRGAGNRDVAGRRQEERDDTVQGRDNRREEEKRNQQA